MRFLTRIRKTVYLDRSMAREFSSCKMTVLPSCSAEAVEGMRPDVFPVAMAPVHWTFLPEQS